MDSVVHLQSQQDASQNFIVEAPDGGFFESRLVQRDHDKVICYLSSHSGCNLSCRFCHLTATKQTMMMSASMGDYVRQAQRVLDAYKKKIEAGHPRATRINFNFMARGEPLRNDSIIDRAGVLFDLLEQMSARLNLKPKFKISTILPAGFTGDLTRIFAKPNVELYYSLYSLDPAFRKRWIPKAMHPDAAFELIRQMQVKWGRQIVLHWAVIDGHNDKLVDVDQILHRLHTHQIDARFNLVRYNPHDDRHGVEAPTERLNDIVRSLSREIDCKIIPRVGEDVYASCGVFYS